MKVCGSAECEKAGVPQPDEAFAVDRTREDGMAWCCLECNRRRAAEWYERNKQRKIQRSLEYKAQYNGSGTELKPDQLFKATARTRRDKIKRQVLEEQSAEFKLIRFTESEWLFCLLQGQALGLKPDDFVRYLVKDALLAAEREKEGED